MKRLFAGLLFAVLLMGCSDEERISVSPTFKLPVTFGDGTEGEYVLIGKEGRLGFLIGSGKKGESEVQPIVHGKANKYMWHFWGEKEEFEGPLKIIGIDEEGEEHKILKDSNGKIWAYSTHIGVSPNNGADTHIPSLMEFPSAGIWELHVYIGETLFDEIAVNVQ